jgi:hypothetical protein
MLEDPRINFAISENRQPVGVNHLGFRVDTDEELRGMRAQLAAADTRMVEESEQGCCYAKRCCIPAERAQPACSVAK